MDNGKRKDILKFAGAALLACFSVACSEEKNYLVDREISPTKIEQIQKQVEADTSSEVARHFEGSMFKKGAKHLFYAVTNLVNNSGDYQQNKDKAVKAARDFITSQYRIEAIRILMKTPSSANGSYNIYFMIYDPDHKIILNNIVSKDKNGAEELMREALEKDVVIAVLYFDPMGNIGNKGLNQNSKFWKLMTDYIDSKMR